MAGGNHTLRVYESVEELVANQDNPTPLVGLNERVNPHDNFAIYLKLERYNPFGSVKDRIALSMLNGTEILDGQTLVEPSSGNTGVALVALANARNIPSEIAVPERIPEEKKVLLRLLGAELWEAADDLCPVFPNEGARGLVRSMVESPATKGRYVSPNQYENELNALAHYRTTGPEIWRQTQGQVDYFFASLGTCGTITGVGRFLKEMKPSVTIVGVEPAVTEHSLPGMKRITGLREDLVPKILDMSVVDHIVAVEDEAAYRTGMKLARKAGLLVGPTTGAIATVALDYAAHNDGLAVVISPDDALKYASFYRDAMDRLGA